jgi:hypothetical protein
MLNPSGPKRTTVRIRTIKKKWENNETNRKRRANRRKKIMINKKKEDETVVLRKGKMERLKRKVSKERNKIKSVQYFFMLFKCV